jgi:hypothetical protein
MQICITTQHAYQRLQVHHHLSGAECEQAEMASSHCLEGKACAHVKWGEGHKFVGAGRTGAGQACGGWLVRVLGADIATRVPMVMRVLSRTGIPETEVRSEAKQ